LGRIRKDHYGSNTPIAGNLAPCFLLFQISKKFFSIRLLTFFLIIHFFRRRTPHNFIFLGMFTLAEGFMLGCVTATYDVNEVGTNQLVKCFSVL
jgi:hypothetical protein